MASAAELLILIKARDEASSKIKGIGESMGGLGKTLGIVGGVGVAALAGIGVAAVKMGADFEGKMREVNTMVGLSEEDFASLNSQVLELSKEVGKSGTELAGALYQAISAGVPATEAIDMLRVSAQAAVGGVTDTETAVDGLTSVMNAFKIPTKDAEKVADVMFTTVKSGKTTFEELSASMFNVSPIAAAAGVKFDEVSAAIATITKAGVPTSVATTQLRATIQSIIKPSEDMKVAMENLGYASGDTMIAELGLKGSLDAIVESSGGNQEALGKIFGSVEGLGAVLSLTGENAKTFESDLTSVMESTGASTTAYNEINKGTGRQFEVLINKVKGLVTELGMKLLPVLTPIIDAFMQVVEALPMEEIGAMISELLPPLISQFVDLFKSLPIDALIKLSTMAMKPMISILQLLMTVLQPVIDALSWLIEKIAGPLGTAFDWLGKAIGNIGSFFGNLFSFQEGGVVGGPVGAPVPAIVHGGETIIPVGGFGGGVGGGTVVYNITQNIGGSVVTERQLARYMREQLLLIKSSNVTSGL